MPALRDYVFEAIRIGGSEVGVIASIESITDATGVVVCPALADGSPSTRFNGQYMQRREIPTAPSGTDRQRTCTTYDGATGSLTPSTAYVEVDGSTERLIVSPYPPYDFDRACQRALARAYRRYEVPLPCYQGTHYPLHAFPWITKPGDLVGPRVTRYSSPVLTRNRGMDDWSALTVADDVATTTPPDFWTLAGASGTVQRSVTHARRGRYTCALTRSGTDVTLTQSPGPGSAPAGASSLLSNYSTGGGQSSLAGQSVTAVLNGVATVADRLYVEILDGVGTSTSSAHTGGGTLEELTVTRTLDAAATYCSVRAVVKTGNTTAYLDECYLLFGSSVPDMCRQDAYQWPGPQVPVGFRQSSNAISLELPRAAFGEQYLLFTRRPYAQFAAATIELGTGAADVLVSDAPLTLIAVGTLEQLFADLAMRADEASKTRYERLRDEWAAQWAIMSPSFTVSEQPARGGLPTRNPMRPRVGRF